jgi:5-oxoprolinase (ATP-hydrolysing)
MQYAVKYQHELYASSLKPGDVLLSNHPTAGGTHLPDITVITPVFDGDANIIYYTASRGHHRDIGGYEGISGNANATEIWQEGAAVLSFKLISDGHFDEVGITNILVEDPAKYPHCVGSNSLQDNLSDLKAQVAANAKGASLIHDLFAEYGGPVVQVHPIPIYDWETFTDLHGIVLHVSYPKECRERSPLLPPIHLLHITSSTHSQSNR